LKILRVATIKSKRPPEP